MVSGLSVYTYAHNDMYAFPCTYKHAHTAAPLIKKKMNFKGVIITMIVLFHDFFFFYFILNLNNLVWSLTFNNC